MMLKSNIETALIIVTYNSEKDIQRCIESIYMHVKNISQTEIIVVDNNSSDATLQILENIKYKFDNLSVIQLEENIGFGRANNIGFQAVNADFYVLLNADAWLIGDSIMPALNAMRSNNNVVICGLPLVFPDGSPQTSSHFYSAWTRWALKLLGVRLFIMWLFKIKVMRKFLVKLPMGGEFIKTQLQPKFDIDNLNTQIISNNIRDVDWVCGAAMVLQGNFVREVGGFDPKIFLYGEDEDLCITACRMAKRVSTIDTMPVVHMLGWGGGRFNRKVADFKYVSLGYFINKNIHSYLDRFLMTLLLPVYVYGWRRFFYIFWVKNDSSKKN
ncbi:MAG: glycosyltransferase family 2 protein [Proteobacteria bacterium]|nr:glycosyltransferase family 2 protein [Pseudomonadota bacterium]